MSKGTVQPRGVHRESLFSMAAHAIHIVAMFIMAVAAVESAQAQQPKEPGESAVAKEAAEFYEFYTFYQSKWQIEKETEGKKETFTAECSGSAGGCNVYVGGGMGRTHNKE